MFKYKLKEIHVPFLCTLTLQPVFNCPHSCAWRGTTNCCTSWRSLMARWCRCDWVLPLWQPPPSPLRPQGPANCQRWVAEQQPVSAWLGLMFGTCACLIWLIDDCLYSAVLRSRADSLRSHVILCEWQAFYIVGFFFIIHRSAVLTLTALAWLVPRETAAISAQVVCTPYNHTPCHFMQSYIRKVYVCLAVTYHLHFWQNDRDLLRATAVCHHVCVVDFWLKSGVSWGGSQVFSTG